MNRLSDVGRVPALIAASIPTLLRRSAAVGVTAILLISLSFAAPAQAVLERCSGPMAVTPDKKDTMRVCIAWDSQVVWGFIRYYPNQNLSPYRYSEYDFSIQLYVQNQTYGQPTFATLDPGTVDDLGWRFDLVQDPPQPNIGGADNMQTYYARGTVAVNGQQSTGITGQSPSATT